MKTIFALFSIICISCAPTPTAIVPPMDSGNVETVQIKSIIPDSTKVDSLKK